MSTQFTPRYSISTERFTWSNKEFFAEISSLGVRGFERIYPDACDVGLSIRSERTGEEVWFYLETEHRDREGDVTHWTLKPTNEAVRKNPGLKGVKMTVFND